MVCTAWSTDAVAAALALHALPFAPANAAQWIFDNLKNALIINVVLAVFNMMPIPPLDGGNVIGGLLPPRWGQRFDALIRPYGFILLYALMLTNGFDYLVVAPAVFILSWLR